MKLELYKPYLTQGGWKAVVVGYDETSGLFEAWHRGEVKTFWHNPDGTGHDISGFDIIAEWQKPKPPRTCEFWVNINACGDTVWFSERFNSKIKADEHANPSRIACKHVVWTEGE